MAKNLIDAAKTGNRLETLKALRSLLSERLQESGSDRDIASMSRRLMQCLTEIEELEKERDESKHGDSIDELRKRFNINT